MADAETLADEGERGHLTIRQRAVERIVVAAAQVEGTCQSRSGLGRLTGRELPRAVVDVAADHVRAEVEVAAQWGRPLAATAAAVRSSVIEALGADCGMDVEQVTVHIGAVEPPGRAEPRSVV